MGIRIVLRIAYVCTLYKYKPTSYTSIQRKLKGVRDIVSNSRLFRRVQEDVTTDTVVINVCNK